jgi:GNAT superfamily N-acetyltransferase
MQQIGVAMEVFPSMFDAPEGRLPIPEAGEPCLGLHAVAIGGWTDNGASLVFQNSYGPTWGDNGRGVLTKQYADRYMREASTLRVGACGPNHKNWDEVFAATGFDLARAWSSSDKAVAGQVSLKERRFDYQFYPVISLGRGCYVEVIEVRSGPTVSREGWAHLYHLPPGSERRSVLRELFILPGARLRGLGRALELVAAERAIDRGSHVLQLDLNEADAYGPSMQAARTFAVQSGYTWIEGAISPGSINSYAEKRLAPNVFVA